MKTRSEQLREQAAEFHRRHPEVWQLFERFALEKWRAGFKSYSADCVMHRVRWESPYGDRHGELPGDDFKINNNLVALYARRFLRLHPECGEFFRTRRLPSETRKAG